MTDGLGLSAIELERGSFHPANIMTFARCGHLDSCQPTVAYDGRTISYNTDEHVRYRMLDVRNRKHAPYDVDIRYRTYPMNDIATYSIVCET
jgi:phosphoribosyl 1,2-cyclic phosphodiesterase